MSHFLTESPKLRETAEKLLKFVNEECIPAEQVYESKVSQDYKDRWTSVPKVIETLKSKAKKLGLWNLFLPPNYAESAGWTSLEYARLCQIIGRSFLAPEATNTSAPDTGNMEVLARYGTQDQKEKWLAPLLNGEIRSAFCMTEPGVASSDATNIRMSIHREGDQWVINGRKWWVSGGGDPRCKLLFVMGKTDPYNANVHKQQSVLLVPSDTKGIRIVRPMQLFGYDDAPHGKSSK